MSATTPALGIRIPSQSIERQPHIDLRPAISAVAGYGRKVLSFAARAADYPYRNVGQVGQAESISYYGAASVEDYTLDPPHVVSREYTIATDPSPMAAVRGIVRAMRTNRASDRSAPRHRQEPTRRQPKHRL